MSEKPRAAPAPSTTEISSQLDFGSRSPRLGLILFVLLYGGFGGLAVYLMLAESRADRASGTFASAQNIGLAALYLMGAYLLLVYVVFGAQRFRFTDSTLTVLTWRGWQSFEWREIKRATVSTYKGNVELVLFVGSARRISVPIGSFRKGVTLLNAVRGRLPVPIEASQAQLTLISDA